MTNANERILLHKEETTTELADATYKALGDLLTTSKNVLPADTLLQMHLDNKAGLLELFRHASGLCGVIRFVHFRWMSMISGRDDMKDSTLLSDQANLFSSLLNEYPGAFPEDQREAVRQELRKLVHEAVKACVAAVGPQAEKLKEVVRGIVDYLQLLHLGDARIVLIELPVGNSIPVKLSASRIRAQLGKEPIVIRASFPRNDKPKAGVTRKELLVKKLTEFEFRPNDLVVFIDEWVTGSNFHAILEVIDKTLSKMKGIYLLPVGLMTNTSTDHPRYGSGFSGLHDMVLGKLGLPNGSFRHVFPPIQSRFPKTDYFFWGEHDRTAGYRKMQIYGSIFSTLDKAIESLRTDEDALFLAKFYHLQGLASRANEGEPESNISTGVRSRSQARQRVL